MDDLFRFLFRAVDVAPEYTSTRCLAVTQSREACSRCRDVCPHQAITIGREVEIDDVDCSGCGLCVQVCPSQALKPKASYQPGHDLRCSQVAGQAQSVVCLGRLQSSDLLRLLGRRDRLTLARSDCADCPIGSAAMIDAVTGLVADAEALAEVHGRQIAISVIETDRLDKPREGGSVSRRELLRGGWRGAQLGTAAMLAPLDPGEGQDGDLPAELQRRYRLIELAEPEPDKLVPWRLPRVGDGCIMCPVCTDVCPTGAFGRDFTKHEGDGAVLELQPERCVGCDACVQACPVNVIDMDEKVSWQELSGGTVEAYLRSPDEGIEGGVAR